MDRLQRHNQLGRGTVRIGNDIALRKAGECIGIHFRHHQRHIGIHAEGGAVVDDDTALRGSLRRIFPGNVATGGKQRHVVAREVEIIEGFRFQGLVAERHFRPERATAGNSGHFIGGEHAFLQDVHHFAAHISGGTDDGDAIAHLPRPFDSWIGPVP